MSESVGVLASDVEFLLFERRYGGFLLYVTGFSKSYKGTTMNPKAAPRPFQGKEETLQNPPVGNCIFL